MPSAGASVKIITVAVAHERNKIHSNLVSSIQRWLVNTKFGEKSSTNRRRVSHQFSLSLPIRIASNFHVQNFHSNWTQPSQLWIWPIENPQWKRSATNERDEFIPSNFNSFQAFDQSFQFNTDLPRDIAQDIFSTLFAAFEIRRPPAKAAPCIVFGSV